MVKSAWKQDSCYACKEPASTKEHAPPECFFPEQLRDGLIKVPSCRAHNNANSKDVEYVRNVMASAAELGPESKSVFQKALRSVMRRPALCATTYPMIHVLQFKGEETGAFEVDLKRFDRVMTAITQALHFRDCHLKVNRWQVFSPSLHSDETLSGQNDPQEPLRSLLATLRYRYLPTSHPEVFTYGVAERPGIGHVYQLVFYDVVIVNVWPKKH